MCDICLEDDIIGSVVNCGVCKSNACTACYLTYLEAHAMTSQRCFGKDCVETLWTGIPEVENAVFQRFKVVTLRGEDAECYDMLRQDVVSREEKASKKRKLTTELEKLKAKMKGVKVKLADISIR